MPIDIAMRAGLKTHPEGTCSQRASYFGCFEPNVPRGPYLEYVNALSSKWPHLQFLSDFMEVGTHPLRWNASLSKEPGAYSTDPKEKGRCVS